MRSLTAEAQHPLAGCDVLRDDDRIDDLATTPIAGAARVILPDPRVRIDAWVRSRVLKKVAGQGACTSWVPGWSAVPGFGQSAWPEQSHGQGGGNSTHPAVEVLLGRVAPLENSPCRGTGLRAQVEPAGLVPSLTKMPLSG